ncbi:MAG: polyribonucleotide nucleotidyltransferase [Chlamydiae bacterium RIFCSPHIGHO2_12_FULL_27_8]|nr:MAG: polyribonucleotide nucleotidyltransferase [Chlamydiae bacterium RIFCSPHIGHO2_12_FULL_27_8]
MQHTRHSFNLNGKEIILETGKIARQANGSVLLHAGDTTILSTACAAKQPMEDVDFLPLKVDYQEKFSSAGKTLGGFIKREGRLSTKEILISRLIDRSIRPLFIDGYYQDTQVLSYVYSYDPLNKPDVLSIISISAALTISDIPFIKPIGAVRVGYINEEFIINPTEEEVKKSSLDLLIAGSNDAILMIEGFCNFLSEEQVLKAIEIGHEAIKVICHGISEFAKKCGKEKNLEGLYKIDQSIINDVSEFSTPLILEALSIKEKKLREKTFDETLSKVKEEFKIGTDDQKFSLKDLNIAFKKVSSNLMRDMILNKNIRIDGRTTTEIRPISVETALFGKTHGSALFTRGETQAIAVCTLGGETMAQKYEDLHGEGLQRFYLQYYFPPFSVGEVGRSGPPGRRELGHGNLAERAILASLPEQKDFPYTIRLESNITESNGSSSMASVCGGSLALMDAGVPLKRPVSGIAMGLILDESQKYSILSDIIGAEDALGDMDFKITGDDTGITAFQMDIKVEGITTEIMKKALDQAKEGRIHILKKMLEVCPKSKDQISTHAPKIETIQINPSKIGIVIGPGGKQIRSIIEETNVEMDISNDGLVSIVSSDQNALNRAKEIVLDLTAEVEIGKTYHGKVTSIKPFGLFVKIFSKEGLCHISEISHSRIENINDFFKEGDPIEVKVLDVNDRGQIKLSHKVLLKQTD